RLAWYNVVQFSPIRFLFFAPRRGCHEPASSVSPGARNVAAAPAARRRRGPAHGRRHGRFPHLGQQHAAFRLEGRGPGNPKRFSTERSEERIDRLPRGLRRTAAGARLPPAETGDARNAEDGNARGPEAETRSDSRPAKAAAEESRGGSPP